MPLCGYQLACVVKYCVACVWSSMLRPALRCWTPCTCRRQVGDPAGVGGLVGYSVRLDSKLSQYTRLMFCTTGVLLRRLMSDPQLAGAAGRGAAVICTCDAGTCQRLLLQHEVCVLAGSLPESALEQYGGSDAHAHM
jgi:hypothetical protein